MTWSLLQQYHSLCYFHHHAPDIFCVPPFFQVSSLTHITSHHPDHPTSQRFSHFPSSCVVTHESAGGQSHVQLTTTSHFTHVATNQLPRAAADWHAVFFLLFLPCITITLPPPLCPHMPLMWWDSSILQESLVFRWLMGGLISWPSYLLNTLLLPPSPFLFCSTNSLLLQHLWL